MKKMGLVILIIVLLDQTIKELVINTMSYHETFSVIGDFFKISPSYNTGGAFSILSGNTAFISIISIIALILIYIFFIKDKKITTKESILYGMLIGGIIGNLIDRITRGYVIDYLNFKIFSYNFPIFNLADTMIVISVFIILIMEVCGKNEISSK